MIKLPKLPKRPGWLPMAGLAIVLTSILVFLSIRTQSHEASNYFENVAIVRQLKQLDARWELDVMKSKMGVNANYDSLVDPLSELNRLHEELRKVASDKQGEDAAKLLAGNVAIDDAIEEKTRLIEHFKSRNSVLRNSLVFLPTAATDIQTASGRAGLRRIPAVVNEVLLDTLVYSQSPSEEAAARIKSQLDWLSSSAAGLPASVTDGLDIFSSHVGVVLREQPAVNELLRDIAVVPTTARIDEFDRLLSEEQRKIDLQIQQDGLFLLVFATALMTLFLYAAVRLIRSHAVINRVNKELHEANAGLERRVAERTHDLLAVNTALTATQGAVRNLLDNADQGFLTVSSDLLIDDQFSAACEVILGGAPAGRSIVDQLCRNNAPDMASTMRSTLESVFRDSTEFTRDLKIELLPTDFNLDGKIVKVNYKFLPDRQRLMLILTDMTQTTMLTETVERERKRLEMIVLAVTEGDAFSALASDYEKFLTEELSELIQRIENPSDASELNRRLHTYKGLLAQFSFLSSPRGLHEVETRLSKTKDWTPRTMRNAVAPEALLADFRRDLEIVTDVLGADFAEAGGRAHLSQTQLQAMEQVARAVLAGEEGRGVSPPLRLLLQTLAGMRMLDVKAALAIHARGTLAQADRLEKQLAPICVAGDEARVPPERYGAFFRSLVHVFRNAVDHGIEAPAERERGGKPSSGSIACDVRDHGDWLDVVIEDDGQGVNQQALRDKLIAAGEDRLKVDGLSVEALVFREGLSSRSVATEVSGRGVGLAAVKAELDRIGGSVTVETKQGAGTRFHFRVPTGKASVFTSNTNVAERIAV